jgi:hypothetical protein
MPMFQLGDWVRVKHTGKVGKVMARFSDETYTVITGRFSFSQYPNFLLEATEPPCSTRNPCATCKDPTTNPPPDAAAAD